MGHIGKPYATIRKHLRQGCTGLKHLGANSNITFCRYVLALDIALCCGLDGRWFESRQILGIFLFTAASRLAVGPTQPPIQWVSRALSLGESGSGVKLINPLHLMPRSRICGVIPPLPSIPSWRGAHLKQRDNFTFYVLS
jgi:hypothetical protein